MIFPLTLVTLAEIFTVSPILNDMSVGLRVIYTSVAPSSVASSSQAEKMVTPKKTAKNNIMLYRFIVLKDL